MIYKIFLSLLVATMLSCGYYSFKGALPPELKTIYISDFQTVISFYNVDQNLTVGVTDAFIEDNTLEIGSDRAAADLILKGKIVDIRFEPFSVDEGASQSKEDKLSVYLAVECYRKDLKKNLWKKKWNRYAVLSSTATQPEIEIALVTIISELSEDVVLNTVAAW